MTVDSIEFEWTFFDLFAPLADYSNQMTTVIMLISLRLHIIDCTGNPKKIISNCFNVYYNIKYQCFSTNDGIENKMNEQRKTIILAHFLNCFIGNANIVFSFIISIISNPYFTIKRNDLILDEMESNGLFIFFSPVFGKHKTKDTKKTL